VACFGIYLSIPKIRKPFCGMDGAVVMKEIRITLASPLMSVMEVLGHDRP
jgi:hypothetical protein